MTIVPLCRTVILHTALVGVLPFVVYLLLLARRRYCAPASRPSLWYDDDDDIPISRSRPGNPAETSAR